MPVVGTPIFHPYVLFDISTFGGLSQIVASYANIVTWSNKNTALTQNQVRIKDQDNDGDVVALAKAIRSVTESNPSLGTEAKDLIIAGYVHSGLEDSNGDGKPDFPSLGPSRNLCAVVCAWDILRQAGLISNKEDAHFRVWLLFLLSPTTQWSDRRGLIETNEERPNNWGLMAGASVAAAKVYLNDSAAVINNANTFIAWMGDTTSPKYPEFEWGEFWFQIPLAAPMGILPPGALFYTDGDGDGVKNDALGVPDPTLLADGCQPEEARRHDFELDTFLYPVPETGYFYEALQGAVVQAAILAANGYPTVWTWQTNALKRAYEFAVDATGSAPVARVRNWTDTNNDEHGELDGTDTAGLLPLNDSSQIGKVLDLKYGLTHAVGLPYQRGKNMIGLDWLYGG